MVNMVAKAIIKKTETMIITYTNTSDNPNIIERAMGTSKIAAHDKST